MDGHEPRATVAASSARPVAVLVVTFNSAHVILECLASLHADSRDVVEVVVVDNGSTDATTVVVEATGHGVRLLRTGANRGYAAAVNAGMAVISPDAAVLVLNPDVCLDPGAVGQLAAALGPGIGVVVPRLRGSDGALARSLRRAPSVGRVAAESLLGGRRAARWGIGEVVGDDCSYRHERDVEWATGAAWLISPMCRRLVGPWDETFFLYSEETDYALRARRIGLRLRFVPTATATHIGGESGSRPQLWALLVRNRVREVRKRRGMLPAALFGVALAVGELVRSAGGSPVHRAGLLALFGRREGVLRRAGAPLAQR